LLAAPTAVQAVVVEPEVPPDVSEARVCLFDTAEEALVSVVGADSDVVARYRAGYLPHKERDNLLRKAVFGKMTGWQSLKWKLGSEHLTPGYHSLSELTSEQWGMFQFWLRNVPEGVWKVTPEVRSPNTYDSRSISDAYTILLCVKIGGEIVKSRYWVGWKEGVADATRYAACGD
jgi:hypothetical protein